MPSAKTYQVIGFVTYYVTIKPRQRELIRSAAIIATAAAASPVPILIWRR